MEAATNPGQSQHIQSTPDSAHVERERPQRTQEAAVPGLADHRAETRHSDVQRDKADLAVVPGWILWLLDPAQAVWGLHYF